MSRKKRRKFTPEFKAKVAMEALKERQSLAEIAQKHSLQPIQISAWKREFVQNAAMLFEKTDRSDQKLKEKEQEEARLYEEIGRLKVQVDWLKKKITLTRNGKQTGTFEIPYITAKEL